MSGTSRLSYRMRNSCIRGKPENLRKIYLSDSLKSVNVVGPFFVPKLRGYLWYRGDFRSKVLPNIRGFNISTFYLFSFPRIY